MVGLDFPICCHSSLPDHLASILSHPRLLYKHIEKRFLHQLGSITNYREIKRLYVRIRNDTETNTNVYKKTWTVFPTLRMMTAISHFRCFSTVIFWPDFLNLIGTFLDTQRYSTKYPHDCRSSQETFICIQCIDIHAGNLFSKRSYKFRL